MEIFFSVKAYIRRSLWVYICGVRKQRIEKGLTPSASPSEVQMNFESVGLAAGMLNTENVRFPSQKIPPPSSSFPPFFFLHNKLWKCEKVFRFHVVEKLSIFKNWWSTWCWPPAQDLGMLLYNRKMF